MPSSSPLWIIGPLLSIAGAYLQYRNKSVSKWLNQRRIDNRKGISESSICPYCGEKVKNMNTYSGKRKGKKAFVCSRYPDCRYVKWV